MNVEEVKRAIIVAVRDLVRDEPCSLEALGSWYERATIIRSIMELDCGDLAVPSALWRYLDDADVRLADTACAEVELLCIERELEAWEFVTPSHKNTG